MTKMVGAIVMVMMMVSIDIGAGKVAATAVTCGEPVARLASCVPYLVGNDKLPTERCCVAARGLNVEADKVERRRYLCTCYQKFAPSLGVVPAKAQHLAPLCKYKPLVPLDPNVDCTSIP